MSYAIPFLNLKNTPIDICIPDLIDEIQIYQKVEMSR